MTKPSAEREEARIERTSGGAQLGGTKFGQQPGEATHTSNRGAGKGRRTDGKPNQS